MLKSFKEIIYFVLENCHVVHIVPKFLTVDEGENINLKCRTSASTRVSWLGPKTILPHLKAFQQNGTLTIANSTIEDAGKYTCQTVLPQGKVINQTATVIVIEKL